MIFCWLEAMLINRLHRKSASKRKEIQIKTFYRILGTVILSYEKFHCSETMQITEENKRIIPGKMKIV